MIPILSKNQIKFIRSLKQKKYRYKFKNYLVEGEKLITDLLTHRVELLEYLVVEDSYSGALPETPIEIYQTDPKTMRAISSMVHPQGILALCKIPEEYFSNRWEFSDFSIYFDGIQDPGNLGTMMRTAEWYGIRQILIGAGTVDPYSPKTIQAAMGSHAYLRLFPCDQSVILDWPHPVLVADMDGQNAYKFAWPERGVLVVGNEGQGISAELLDTDLVKLTIPPVGAARTESLNVSMACTVLLTLRQQYLGTP